ncbi:MAG: acyl carrier protein [Lautropia sp.]|nr:acyl carrier protein [Lautropia sp.]
MLNRDEVNQLLTRALVDLFEIDPARVVPTANIYEDLEIDSIDAIDLIDHIKRETGYRLVAEDFRAVRTVDDIVNAVMKKIDDEQAG